VSEALLRFTGTVQAVGIGSVTVMDARARRVTLPTESQEEDMALAALLYQRVTVTVTPSLKKTAAGAAARTK
jgi:predicted NBD/HSP70 family sugar kinase